MRRIVLIAVTFTLFLASIGLSRGDETGVTLPSRFADQILLRVAVNGHSMWFALNTAVGNAIIAKTVAAGADVKPDSSGRAVADVALGQLDSPRSQLELAPGDWEARGDFTPISGAVGGLLLRSNVVTVDFPKNRVVAYSADEFDASNLQQKRIPLEFTKGGLPIVRVMFGDVPARMVLDTGSNRTMIFPPFSKSVVVAPARIRIDDARIDRTYIHLGDAHFGTDNVPATAWQTKPLTIGAYKFERPVIPVVDRPPAWVTALGVDGLIGREMLRPFRVTFDYADNALYLER